MGPYELKIWVKPVRPPNLSHSVPLRKLPEVRFSSKPAKKKTKRPHGVSPVHKRIKLSSPPIVPKISPPSMQQMLDPSFWTDLEKRRAPNIDWQRQQSITESLEQEMELIRLQMQMDNK